jgi:putative IMPACT (imprinted ancient) family translation regulator
MRCAGKRKKAMTDRENAGLTHVVVVGTRYFGGVKLGIGGLVRAIAPVRKQGLPRRE